MNDEVFSFDIYDLAYEKAVDDYSVYMSGRTSNFSQFELSLYDLIHKASSSELAYLGHLYPCQVYAYLHYRGMHESHPRIRFRKHHRDHNRVSISGASESIKIKIKP